MMTRGGENEARETKLKPLQTQKRRGPRVLRNFNRERSPEDVEKRKFRPVQERGCGKNSKKREVSESTKPALQSWRVLFSKTPR